MPLGDEQSTVSFEEDAGRQRASDLGASLVWGAEKNPDQHAETLQYAKKYGVSPLLVEENLDRYRQADKLNEIDPGELVRSHPRTAEWLSVGDHAAVAMGEVEKFKQIEDAYRKLNPERTWGEFAGDTGIDAVKSVLGMGEIVVGLADLMTFNLAGDVLEGVGYDPRRTNKALDQYYSQKRQSDNLYVQQQKGFWNTMGALWDRPSVAFGTVIESGLPMMGTMAAARAVAARMLSKAGITAPAEVAAFMKRPDVIAKLTAASVGTEGLMAAGQIQEQSRQAGRSWNQSVLYSLLGGGGTAAIGKFGSKLLPDVEAGFAAALSGGRLGTKESLLGAGKNIALGVIKEGPLEELPQSAQEQLFTNLAMGKPWYEGIDEAAAHGLVAGMGMGGGMAVGTEATALIRATEKQSVVTAKSINEQIQFDHIISLAQSNATRERAQDLFSDFLKGVGGDSEIYIPSEVAAQLDDAPEYIQAQLDGTGADVTVPYDVFIDEIAPNEDAMLLLRPHIRMTADGLSLNGLEQGGTSDLKALMQKSERARETLDRSEEYYEELVGQLTATGRMSETEARTSARLVPAYAATVAEDRGIPVEEVYEAMGMRVVGPSEPLVEGGETIAQDRKLMFQENQDFGDQTITEEYIVEETGERMTGEIKVQEIWDETYERRNVAQEILNCLR